MTRTSTQNPFLHDDDETSLPCDGKLVFDTMRQAAVAANVADYQHGTSVKPYRCRYCQLWHLASI